MAIISTYLQHDFIGESSWEKPNEDANSSRIAMVKAKLISDNFLIVMIIESITFGYMARDLDVPGSMERARPWPRTKVWPPSCFRWLCPNIVVASCHHDAAERRLESYEFGPQRPATGQWTATAAGKAS